MNPNNPSIPEGQFTEDNSHNYPESTSRVATPRPSDFNVRTPSSFHASLTADVSQDQSGSSSASNGWQPKPWLDPLSFNGMASGGYTEEERKIFTYSAGNFHYTLNLQILGAGGLQPGPVTYTEWSGHPASTAGTHSSAGGPSTGYPSTLIPTATNTGGGSDIGSPGTSFQGVSNLILPRSVPPAVGWSVVPQQNQQNRQYERYQRNKGPPNPGDAKV